MVKRQTPPPEVVLQRLGPVYLLAIATGLFAIAVGAAIGLASISNLGWVVVALGVISVATCVRGRRRLRATLAKLPDREF
jgi:putative Mn2+ efflux pump MntP